jgi:hypothetical protein
MAFVREPARIAKSLRGVESAQKSEAISKMKWSAFFLQKEKEETIDGKMMV